MVILCGTLAGFAAAEVYARRYIAVCSVCEMLEQMCIMMKYESPTLSQMIDEIRTCSSRPPEFVMKLAENACRADILKALSVNADRLEAEDLHRLTELFSRLGCADKICEQQRLESAANYFKARAKRLGILGGTLAAVLLV
jgi:hypothetical protein